MVSVKDGIVIRLWIGLMLGYGQGWDYLSLLTGNVQVKGKVADRNDLRHKHMVCVIRICELCSSSKCAH